MLSDNSLEHQHASWGLTHSHSVAACIFYAWPKMPWTRPGALKQQFQMLRMAMSRVHQSKNQLSVNHPVDSLVHSPTLNQSPKAKEHPHVETADNVKLHSEF